MGYLDNQQAWRMGRMPHKVVQDNNYQKRLREVLSYL